MTNSFIRPLQIIFAVLDIIAINAVFIITELLFRNYSLIDSHADYMNFSIVLNAFWIVVSFVTNLYFEKNIGTFETFSKRSMHAFVFFLILVSFYLFFFRLIFISRIFLIVLFITIPVILLINRFVYVAINQYLRRHNYLTKKIIILGYNPLSKKLVHCLEGDSINREIVGFCDDYDNIHELSHYPILSNVDGVLEVCKEYKINEIYSTIAPEQNPDIYTLINSAEQNCIRFKIVPDISTFIKRQVHLDYLNEIPIISLRNEPLEDINSRIKKRVFDIAFSLFVILFILSWLIPIVALFIMIDSRGSIFFIQERSGKDNKPFKCIKFRSMVLNEKANTQQTTKNDSRITSFGRFLRKTNLDEFPQFINCLLGQMSIVGPRPHMLKHTDQYSNLINQYMVRQFLKPGITGWAQVNGLRGETKTVEQMKNRVEHDLWYMENWSTWLDLRIIFLTVYNTLRGENNAF